jgi:protein-L-isoaspartate(D-aspartate) O-methyltransferase
MHRFDLLSLWQSPAKSLAFFFVVQVSLLSFAEFRPVAAQTNAELTRLRKKMVDEYIQAAGVKNERVLKAMNETRRHEFVHPSERDKAYFDMALPIGDKQTISSPFIVAYMTEALDPKPEDKVLEIGTGSGYQAAVLSPLVDHVYSIEIVEPLGKKAAALLKKLGYKNITTKVGDGYQGWAEHAPFDKIIVTCSPEKVPQPLVDQLSEGGRIVVPVGERYSQTLYLFRKVDGKLESEALLPTLFVPMTGKAEDGRLVKPDPDNPAVANGGFEEKAFESGAQPGWYYERNLEWVTDAKAPEGKHYIRLENADPGNPAQILQGLSLDGQRVKRIKLTAKIREHEIRYGRDETEFATIAITLYDKDRKELKFLQMGRFTGSSDWGTKTLEFDVPKGTREAILRIGLFGAVGKLEVDDVRIDKQ